MYLLFQLQRSEKEREMFEFELDFKKSFCWHPSLSNDARSENGYGSQRPGLSMGQDWENRSAHSLAHPYQEFPVVPPFPRRTIHLLDNWSQSSLFLIIILLILVTLSLDYVFLLLGENDVGHSLD